MDFLKKITSVFTKSVKDTSEVGKVDTTDVAKVLRTSALVGSAAGLTYLMANLAPESLGPYQPFIMLGLTAALDFLNKLVKNNTKE